MTMTKVLLVLCPLVLTAQSFAAEVGGVTVNTDQAAPGYTLIAPSNSTETTLINLDGEVVHSWPSIYLPGQSVYLLDDGSILRTGEDETNYTFDFPGRGGIIERISWEGELLWSVRVSDQNRSAHHDIEPMPNGGVLVIAWERLSAENAIALGKDSNSLPEQEMLIERIFELQPLPTGGAKVVWQWSPLDHLIQDRDGGADNFGVVANNPGKIDFNFSVREKADWLHINSVDYNAALDQILLTVHGFNEVWVIDHSVDTEAAKKEAGDLIYRYGNPEAYGRGEAAQRVFSGQHDARWVPDGFENAGDIMVFDNGINVIGGGQPGSRPERRSSVVRFQPPLNHAGEYELSADAPYGPAHLSTRYNGGTDSFFSSHISGAHPTAAGTTLICVGAESRIFEVNSRGEVVWDYQHVDTSLQSGPKRKGGIFRAERISPDHLGVQRLHQ